MRSTHRQPVPNRRLDRARSLRLWIGLAVATLLLVAVPVWISDGFWPQSAAQAVVTTRPVAESHLIAWGQAKRELDPALPLPAVRLHLRGQADTGYDLALLVENFTFVTDGEQKGSASAQGHAQVYLNGKLLRSSTGGQIHLGGGLLANGVNVIVVTLNDSDGAFWTHSDALVMDEIALALHAPAQMPVATGRVRYRLAWRWGDATPDASSQGWRVTNDRGYLIHVTQAYLVTAAAELVACPHTHTDQRTSAGTLASKLLDLIGPRRALAGHGNGVGDTSRLPASYVESLGAPTPLTVVTSLGVEPFYCQAHYLVAAGMAWAEQLPRDVEMVGKSLFVAGEYWAPGSHIAVPFTLQTDQAWGALADLMAGPTSEGANHGIVLPHGEDAEIVITRDLGALFTGIDFDALSETEQSTALLRNLTHSITVKALPVEKDQPIVTDLE